MNSQWPTAAAHSLSLITHTHTHTQTLTHIQTTWPNTASYRWHLLINQRWNPHTPGSIDWSRNDLDNKVWSLDKICFSSENKWFKLIWQINTEIYLHQLMYRKSKFNWETIKPGVFRSVTAVDFIPEMLFNIILVFCAKPDRNLTCFLCVSVKWVKTHKRIFFTVFQCFYLPRFVFICLISCCIVYIFPKTWSLRVYWNIWGYCSGQTSTQTKTKSEHQWERERMLTSIKLK